MTPDERARIRAGIPSLIALADRFGDQGTRKVADTLAALLDSPAPVPLSAVLLLGIAIDDSKAEFFAGLACCAAASEARRMWQIARFARARADETRAVLGAMMPRRR